MIPSETPIVTAKINPKGLASKDTLTADEKSTSSARIVPESSTTEAGYTGPFNVDLEDPEIAAGVDLDELDLDVDTPETIEALREVENPYLAPGNILSEEDAIDARALVSVDEADMDDVFTNSMDIDTEDLENFTQGLDEELNATGEGSQDLSDYVDSQK